MTPIFDVSMLDKKWQDIVTDIDALAAAAAQALPDMIWPETSHEVSLVLTDDGGIRALNLDYRGKDMPTNVLSFPVVNAPGLLGDIILARETIISEAQTSGKLTIHHVSHLIIHGLLHLLGYDHITDIDASKMEAIEIAALAKLGIANPYILKA